MKDHRKNNVWPKIYEIIKKKSQNDIFTEALNDCFAMVDDETLTIESTFLNIKLLENEFYELLENAIKKSFGKKLEIIFRIKNKKEKDDPSLIIEKFENQIFDKFSNDNKLLKNQDFLNNKNKVFLKKLTFDTLCLHAGIQKIINFGLKFIKNDLPYQQNSVLFLYGNMGVGKTHIACSLLDEYQKIYPNYNCLYIDTNDLAFDYGNYLKNNDSDISFYLKKFDSYDFFIFDDIQKLEKRNKIGIVVFSLVDFLIKKNAKIIFITSLNNEDLNNLEPSLKSRILSGFKFKIEEPNFEVKKLLIKRFFNQNANNLKVLPEVIEYLATLFDNDIRIIYGHLSTILFFLSEDDSLKVVNIEKIKEIFNNFEIKKTINEKKGETSKKDSLKIICEKFNFNYDEIVGTSRKQEIVEARNIIIYIFKKEFNFTHKVVGKLLNRHHTTITNSMKIVEQKFKKDKSFFNYVKDTFNKKR